MKYLPLSGSNPLVFNFLPHLPQKPLLLNSIIVVFLAISNALLVTMSLYCCKYLFCNYWPFIIIKLSGMNRNQVLLLSSAKHNNIIPNQFIIAKAIFGKKLWKIIPPPYINIKPFIAKLFLLIILTLVSTITYVDTYF